MKTTIELPDDLLAKAKVAAAERRTTLKAMIEHALRRELNEGSVCEGENNWTTNQYGFPVLGSVDGDTVTSEQIYQLLEEEG